MLPRRCLPYFTSPPANHFFSFFRQHPALSNSRRCLRHPLPILMFSSLPFPTIHQTLRLSLHPKSGSFLMTFTPWPFISLISSSPSSHLTPAFCFRGCTTLDTPTSDNHTVSEITALIYYSPTSSSTEVFFDLSETSNPTFFFFFFYKALVFTSSELSFRILF